MNILTKKSVEENDLFGSDEVDSLNNWKLSVDMKLPDRREKIYEKWMINWRRKDGRDLMGRSEKEREELCGI